MGIRGRTYYPQFAWGVVSEGSIVAAVRARDLCLWEQEAAQSACEHSPPPQWVGRCAPFWEISQSSEQFFLLAPVFTVMSLLG